MFNSSVRPRTTDGDLMMTMNPFTGLKNVETNRKEAINKNDTFIFDSALQNVFIHCHLRNLQNSFGIS